MAQETRKTVAQLVITSPAGVETVQGFDAAWHRSFELPRPVNVRLESFVHV